MTAALCSGIARALDPEGAASLSSVEPAGPPAAAQTGSISVGRTRGAACRLLAGIAALAATACHPASPGTSVRVALTYSDALHLDTAEVMLASRTESAPIAHELLLLVPDDLAAMPLTIAVWGRSAGQRAAYGTTTATPKLGATVDVALSLAVCAPTCMGNQLTTCGAEPVSCATACSTTGGAHCVNPTPSNGIDPGAADPLTTITMFTADATINADTGEITGGVTRAAGTGIANDIAYSQAPPFGAGGAPLGIFAFHSLQINGGVTVRVIGARAVVFLVGEAAAIAGVVDVAAGHDAAAEPGPGGGAGASSSGAAGGCGAGASGTHSGDSDGGGGGAGGGTDGGPGGAGGTSHGANGGKMCLPPLLVPLQGGSGGGAGGPGSAATAASGGGGGGGIQITALGSLTITGTISAGGAGGAGGPAAANDGGGGAGGGGGGGILLEAPRVVTTTTTVVRADGGGGGGAAGEQPGSPGDNAPLSAVLAQGGEAGSSSEVEGSGGTGGYAGGGPDVGTDGKTNGGGGGGAVGAIAVRGQATLTGTFSPVPTTSDFPASP